MAEPTSSKPTDNDSAGSEHRKQAAPLLARLALGTAAYSLQNFVLAPIFTARTIHDRLLPNRETHPTESKTYPVRPKLAVRIFFPNATKPAEPTKLPVLLSIHGGGFVVGDPLDDDLWNSRFSNQHNALVVALNYAKAPSNAFPGPARDLQALIPAVLDDPALQPYIDTAKIGITGFSAGGNLVLTVVQDAAIRERITAGAMPIYPVTDLSLKRAQKTPTRRYKAALGGSRARTKDPLAPMAPIFDWCYVPVGQDLRDPQLSPYFADRKNLPKRIWIVGCELDMLGHEAWRAACRYAGKPEPSLDQPVGQEQPAGAELGKESGELGMLITEGDEKFAFTVKDSQGEIRWLLIPDAAHGFNMPGVLGKDKVEDEDAALKTEKLLRMAGEWLYGQ